MIQCQRVDALRIEAPGRSEADAERAEPVARLSGAGGQLQLDGSKIFALPKIAKLA